ncbi:imidazole glycerol phosphate synthase subunit HisH [Ammoniphilus resinae]|uniref:Imidazole glycerol phosphate synthase subunit HisH n=1 Tax=Ammoniphilus resinae TaxID=861532 RepID=A0ABS4GQQ5_9BACL|nr:imidazole glycerol phosphate synthase subunit HisH [Ammoniphilus resinae]MBP1932603.1 glutamine amidotransferase [Ammoniphilus resinae]
MIAIIDYGMGNLHSVSKAIERLGYDYQIIDQPEQLKEAQGAILPGVGAFGDAMRNLQERDFIPAIKQYAASGRPLFGICLGMQLLFAESEEHGNHQGIGLFPGVVRRFQGDYKVPHMGWNKLQFLREHSILQGVEEGYAYFVHSYFLQPETTDSDVLLATADYYQEVPAIIGKGNVMATQFHPEKSGEVGMQILRNFAQMVKEGT